MKKPIMLRDCVCLELGQINPKCITTIPSLWAHQTVPLLRFAGHVYHVIVVKDSNNVAMRRVYLMELDGTRYLKRQRTVYTGIKGTKNWQQKALIAAGHTKEDITAAICAARLRGEF